MIVVRSSWTFLEETAANAADKYVLCHRSTLHRPHLATQYSVSKAPRAFRCRQYLVHSHDAHRHEACEYSGQCDNTSPDEEMAREPLWGLFLEVQK